MSGCSIHHFRTIDRPFTQKEMQEIDSWSSRFSPTSTAVTYIYHYSSFKMSVDDVFPVYFDAMFHVNNWGTRQLMFRFPKNMVDIVMLEKFSHNDEYDYIYLRFQEVAEYVIMELYYAEEEGGDWIEEDGFPLEPLLPLREEILNGDYRSLYLSWLMIQQRRTPWEDDDFEEEEEEEEEEAELTMPPIPGNLQKLSAAQRSLMDVFSIDESLVNAAAALSPNAAQQTTDYEKLIGRLSKAEKEAYLLRFVTDQPGIKMQLRQRLETLSGGKKSLAFGKSPSWEKLVETAQQKSKAAAIEHEIAHQKAVEAARLARMEELEAMIPKKEAMWQEAAKHLENTYSSAYKAATKIICDLREIAEYENDLITFDIELRNWIAAFTRRPGFIKKLREKGMLKNKIII